jgi:hypothetical protein
LALAFARYLIPIFLASEDASDMTGQALHSNGGSVLST